jgi:DmsE family decaheme c-type cytochrome
MQDSLWRHSGRGLFRFLFLAALIPLLLTSVLSQTNKTAAQPAGITGPPPGAQYVGSDTCKTCHEDIYTKHFEGTPHFSLTKTGNHGCEDCHGPGSAHVEAGGEVSKIISFKTLNVTQSSNICLKCHAASHEQANFLRSIHAINNVGCTTCHSPHNAKIVRSLLKDSQPALCYGCHTVQKAEFSRPFRHRVNQGLIVCSDCHNPHGSEQLHQLRTSSAQDQVCFKCHTDKRGPFVYEHVPVKTEGCVACHVPHGSTNPRLLKVSQVNLLCLQCHTLAMSNVPSQPPIGPAHNQAAKYQSCTMCHAFIHGSNFSEVFFKP